MTIQLAYNCHMENCTGFKPDNTPFYILIATVIFVVLVVGTAEAVTSRQRSRLLQDGIAAGAEIEKITVRKVLKDGTVEAELTLKITPPDGDVFEAQADGKFPISELPQVGWMINVRYSERDRHRIAVEGAAAPPDERGSGDNGDP
ncbi:hypothetical protein ACWD4N_03285 [Streptomyces sp. NPDC002586]